MMHFKKYPAEIKEDMQHRAWSATMFQARVLRFVLCLENLPALQASYKIVRGLCLKGIASPKNFMMYKNTVQQNSWKKSCSWAG